MLTIATIGPEKSLSWDAANKYDSEANINIHSSVQDVVTAFLARKVDCAILPVYNTREGENKQYFKLFEQLNQGNWIDNVTLHSDLSLGTIEPDASFDDIKLLVGRREVFNQCAEYIDLNVSAIPQMTVTDIHETIDDFLHRGEKGVGFIHSSNILKEKGLTILEREVAPHNRTRFAVFSHLLPQPTGYDATTFVTVPLDDRVGLLVDILGEFSRRGINILDMRTENDLKTQKLQIYLEAEGHINTPALKSAIDFIESRVIQQPDSISVLGSFPRLDMRTKHIKSIGFIGTGAMSKWFGERLENEGYDVFYSGRTTSLRPEEMIRHVDVIVICVPISATEETIRQYGPMLGVNKCLVILAGESETSVNAALETTSKDIEVMLVHNLWGPQASTMKDKNAIVVRTDRSGLLCSEFEAFLYKHGADIYHDSAQKHDLLMGVGQKLPTAISVALAMTLQENDITSEDIASHCTLTSLYPMLAMARVHSQNSRTYAEIMSAAGEGRKIVDDFLKNIQQIMKLGNDGEIQSLSEQITKNKKHFNDSFLQARMEQAKAVDDVLGKMI